jgi:hypothetical protein
MARWAETGHLATDTLADFPEEGSTPRVIGLAVETQAGDDGYVVPIRPVRSTRWRVDPGLPFTPEQVQDGLAGLVQAAGLPVEDSVPERLAFMFDNPLHWPIRGDSMTVAAVLAVLDQMSGQTSPVLRAAVALVEPRPGGRLDQVSGVKAKLEAAHRECGRLSLVVVPPGLGVDRNRIDEVWEVRSLADLAGRLHAAHLLAPLLAARGPLTRPEAAQVLDRLRWQVTQEQRYAEAAWLGDRVRQVGPAGPPDPAVWTDLASLHAQACRHNGRFADATALSAVIRDRLAGLGDLVSDDDEADAAAEYAAARFSTHRFTDIPPVLCPWADRAEADPRRFRPLTRVKVWNTLGRALAVLSRPGWDELFGRSLELSRRLQDDEDTDRTTHYRIHARLRNGRLCEAQQDLEAAPGLSGPAAAGSPWAAFLRANLARLEKNIWQDDVLEARLRAGERPYPVWLYVQATARQPGRAAADVQERLAVAIQLLRCEAGGVPGNICHLFAAFLDLYSAAAGRDTGRWSAAVTAVREFLADTDEAIRSYYAPACSCDPASPDRGRAETLLALVPYF